MSVSSTLQPVAGQMRGNRLVWICASLLAVIAIASVAAPFLVANDYQTTEFNNIFSPPTFEGQHYFGTDDLGRDLFVRTMLGVRITLFVAVIASFVSLFIGVIYGAIAGYVGGKVDALMMRLVDAMYALPFIFFVILLMVVFERSLLLIFIAIGAINWLDMARIVRGQTLSLKQRSFVDAAKLIGVSPFGIVWRHIMPNLLGLVIVYMTLTIPQAILVESFLSFLGLGVQEPQTSLGALVNGGTNHVQSATWLMVIPATVLAVILVCFNFLGDGLREFADPKSKT
ncbi:MAG: ABC transporter permease [Woeseiaceae bacterium]